MHQDNLEYQSYMLRLWRVREVDHWVWRATLQPIPQGPVRGFATLADLVAALESQTPPLLTDPLDPAAPVDAASIIEGI